MHGNRPYRLILSQKANLNILANLSCFIVVALPLSQDASATIRSIYVHYWRFNGQETRCVLAGRDALADAAMIKRALQYSAECTLPFSSFAFDTSCRSSHRRFHFSFWQALADDESRPIGWALHCINQSLGINDLLGDINSSHSQINFANKLS